jgi:signal transduction histidine kinase
VTRRILIALLTLIIALVGGAGTLLALNATNHDRASFDAEAEETARAYAAVYQAELSPLSSLTSEQETIGDSESAVNNEVQATGDSLLALQILPAGGDTADVIKYTLTSPNHALQETNRLVAAVNATTILPAGDWVALATRAEFEAPPATRAYAAVSSTSSWLLVAYPIYSADKVDGPSGVLVLARPYAPLNSAIRTLWLILGAISVAAILAAALIAVWLAQWVSKPLAGLDTAARRLADGDLSIRARDNYGPPELRRMSRTFNTMAGRLETLVHGSRAAIADVSHQLRTPLAALRLRLDFLAADAADGDPEMASELAGAQEEVARLSRLVDGLLAVARAENVTPQPRAIDVTAIAEERVAAWNPVAEDRGIALAALSGDALGPVLGWIGDGHLEQVLDNVIANALDAIGEQIGGPPGRVAVTAGPSEGGVLVSVADNGPGMGPEDRERAFLRFTSSSPGAGSGIGGTGIGLAIVHRLVTSNGGTARLTDTPGGGLTVLLEFPAASASSATDPGAGVSAAPVGTAVGNTKFAR